MMSKWEPAKEIRKEATSQTEKYKKNQLEYKEGISKKRYSQWLVKLAENSLYV